MEKLWRYQLPEPGMLKITGRDQVAFLQRQTTNDIRNLKAGTTLANVLTSPEGRIVDVFRMLSAPDSLMAITLPARSQTTFQFLKNRIFFMDQVSLGDLSSQFILNEISEIAAPRVQHALGFERLPDKGQAINAAWQDQTVTLLWNGPPLGMGFLLLTSAETRKEIDFALQDAGVDSISQQVHEVLRVQTGLPGESGELTNKYTPLEVGLVDFVSSTKGCYTGQEVLARQVNYEKINQQICGLRLEKAISPGTRLWVEGHSVGTITSAVESPDFGPIALAVVRRPHDQPGSLLYAGHEKENLTPAIVSILPFQ